MATATLKHTPQCAHTHTQSAHTHPAAHLLLCVPVVAGQAVCARELPHRAQRRVRLGSCAPLGYELAGHCQGGACSMEEGVVVRVCGRVRWGGVVFYMAAVPHLALAGQGGGLQHGQGREGGGVSMAWS